MQALISPYPVCIEFPIQWGDMDAFLHLNNTVYFRYFENVRIEYAEKIRYLEYMNRTGFGPILSETSCRFRIPLSYPDIVTVGTRLKSLEADRFTMEYVVVSHQHRKVAATGEALIVSFDYNTGCKAPVPDEIRNRMVELEKEPSVEKVI